VVRPHSRFLVRLEMTGLMRLVRSENPEKLEFVFGVSCFCGNPAFGCGGAEAPNRLLGESCLSRASSLAILFGALAEGPHWGRRRAEMVLGPFAETKGPRRMGRHPI